MGYEEVDDFLADVLEDDRYRRHKSVRERVGHAAAWCMCHGYADYEVRTKERLGTAVMTAAVVGVNQIIDFRTGINLIGSTADFIITLTQ